MKKRFFLVAGFLAILLGVSALTFFVFFRSDSRATQKVPFSQPDPKQRLSQELENAGLSFTAPPQVLGDLIEASISGHVVLFSQTGNFQTQTRTLQLVLPRLKMENKAGKTIDLRFNKVVIRD